VFAAAGTEQKNVHACANRMGSKPCRSHESPGRRKGKFTVIPDDVPSASIRNNANSYACRAEAAMISCSVATWRAKAPRPDAVADTVVCGFLPTKAFSTAT
jgi:hypothetical protein